MSSAAAINKALTFAMSREDAGVSRMFVQAGFTRVPVDKANIVVFGGGPDVNPFLYGERRHPATSVSYPCDMQDIRTLKSISSAQARVGICRGGQFLNVMCGGSMYQHVDGHAVGSLHPIYDMRQRAHHKRLDQLPFVLATSTHHQMMIPTDAARILFAARQARRKETSEVVETYSDEERAQIVDDAEVVSYPDQNTLCFQPHPEYITPGNGECRGLFFELLAEQFLSEKEADELFSRMACNLALLDPVRGA